MAALRHTVRKLAGGDANEPIDPADRAVARFAAQLETLSPRAYDHGSRRALISLDGRPTH
jgi:hypothetical protein